MAVCVGRTYSIQPHNSVNPQAHQLHRGRQAPTCTSTPARFQLTTALKRYFPTLIVADADGFVDPGHKDLAVADGPGAGDGDDGLHRLLHHVVRNHSLQLHLGQQVYGVLPSTVELRVPLLPPMSARLRDGHALYANLHQGILYRIQLRRLYHRFNLLHLSQSSRLLALRQTLAYYARRGCGGSIKNPPHTPRDVTWPVRVSVAYQCAHS